MLKNIKRWLTWQITGKTVDRFLTVNCQLLLEEFTDLEFIKFRFRKKDYEFNRSTTNNIQNKES